MKRIISLALCCAFLSLSGEFPERQAQAPGMSGAMLIMFCAVVGSVMVFWVYKTYETPKLRWLVLEKSHYDGNWMPVVTNQVFVGPALARALPAFQASMTDDLASYRVKEIDPPASNFRVQHIPGSAEQPFLYATH